MAELGVLYAFVVLFLVVLGILWFFLPFAVFGTQPKIERLIQEAKVTNEILCDIRDLLKTNSTPK